MASPNIDAKCRFYIRGWQRRGKKEEEEEVLAIEAHTNKQSNNALQNEQVGAFPLFVFFSPPAYSFPIVSFRHGMGWDYTHNVLEHYVFIHIRKKLAYLILRYSCLCPGFN